jgi:inner membrane protein
VDNVTHAFVGAAMAEVALPRDAAPRLRAAAIGVGVIAANAPDVDLLYTRITEPPLGYLLHHRGHSHTLAGLIVLFALIASAAWIIRRARSGDDLGVRRCSLLISAALASHVMMDAANSYGTHPLWPFSSRWFYVDAVFVVEPWLWTVLGAALALNAGRRARLLIAALMLVLFTGVTVVGLVPLLIVLAMLAAAGTAAITTRSWTRRGRAGAALLVTAIVFAVMPSFSRMARMQVRAAMDGDPPIDIVADANPGMPWCWSILTLEHAGAADALVARRGTLSLLPRLWPASSCPSVRLSGEAATDIAPGGPVLWHRRWRIDLPELRALNERDCRVAAWLQYGRVPYVDAGSIADLRFESPMRGNFTRMRLTAASPACPDNVTGWTPPRRDILTAR